MALDLLPLTPALGAEVRGIDLAVEPGAEEREALVAALNRYGVLVFRKQTITEEQQKAFTRGFGTVQSPFGGKRVGKETLFVGNVIAPDGIPGEIANGEMWFHQDGCYSEKPTKQSFLYALEIPERGGNTKFASTARAFANLPIDLRERAIDADIHFTFHYDSVVRDEKTKTGPQFTHPLVIAHPATGLPLLFCNRLMANAIVGWPESESAATIERLCAELERPDNVYEHVWTVGDLVVWDNLATVHARTDFDPNARRLLRRTTTIGTRPVAYRDVRTAERQASPA